MKSKLLIISLLLLLQYACKGPTPEAEYIVDAELSAFTQLNGEADYQYENGVLIGTSKMGTPNSFLATKTVYADFILEFEVLVDEGLNSGVQIRSNSTPDYQNGRVHGYQVEIDTSPRAWSGGIYDEARRGWMYPLSLNTAARSAFVNGEWNLYRVEAIGNMISTWINGVPVAHVVDDMTSEGFIAFQVHSIYNEKDEGKQVRWKNITIDTTDLASKSIVSTAPQESYLDNSLTKEETLAGWQMADSDASYIEGFEDYEIKFDFRLADSIQTVQHYSGDHYFSMRQLDKIYPPGSLYEMVTAQNLSERGNPSMRYKGANQWNRAHIKVRDNRIEHWLNGIMVVDHEIQEGAELALTFPDDRDGVNYKNWKLKL